MKKIVTVDGDVLTVDGEAVETDDDGTTTEYNIGAGLQLDAETNTLSVNAASAVEEGNTNPVMSAAVWGLIGNLSDLTTTAKENLVAAINEVAKTGSGGAGSIDLRTADGYIQYSNDGGETWENLIALADLKGEKGDTGATGPQGVPGERGPQGETGPQGPQGKTGPAGPQGKTGPAGQDGAPGKDGSPGKDGTDGAPGQDGYSPSASVAETATGATITITDKTGTTTAEIKNGKDGAPGKDGTNGAPGTPGTNGTDGKDGKNGTTFTPSVSAAGDLSWTNDGGKANPAPVNLKGPPGADYTLTDADKTEIAAEAAAALAGTSLPAPASAAVGQIVKIKAVDAAGRITQTEAVDMPSGGGGNVVNNYNTINQYYYSGPVTGKYDLKEGYAFTSDIYIAQDGTETSQTGLNFAVTDHIPVEANVPYTTYGQGYALYDAEKVFLSAVISNTDYGQIREFTPTQAGFVRVTFRRADNGGRDFCRLCKSEDRLKPMAAYLPQQSPFYDPAITCNVDLYGDSNSYGYGLSDPQNSWANRLGALITSMPTAIINGNAQMSAFSSVYQSAPLLRTGGVVYLSAYTDSFVINANYVGAIDIKIDGEAQTQMTASPATYNVSLGYHAIELRGVSGQNVINSISTNKTRSFVNHAASGTNSSSLPITAPSGNVAIVMYGTNDRIRDYGATADNISNFATLCAANGIMVYLFSPIPTKSGGETDASYKQTISDVISQIPDINYINVYKDIQLFSLLSTQTLYSDNLHLNDYGHEVLYSIAASELHLAALNSVFD